MTAHDSIPADERALLTQAVAIIEAERASIVFSFAENDGKVRDYYAKRWILRYDRFLKPARKYLGRKPK